jgi:hypothetical protein
VEKKDPLPDDYTPEEDWRQNYLRRNGTQVENQAEGFMICIDIALLEDHSTRLASRTMLLPVVPGVPFVSGLAA